MQRLVRLVGQHELAIKLCYTLSAQQVTEKSAGADGQACLCLNTTQAQAFFSSIFGCVLVAAASA